MWLWIRLLLFTPILLVSNSDAQFWGNRRQYGPPPSTGDCPINQGQSSFRCVPHFQCPGFESRFNNYYCQWENGQPLICCQTPPAEQGCGLLHGAAPRPHDRVFSAIVGGISLRAASTSPWMAAVGERLANGSIDWFCGGSLINTNTVVTAAHCTLRRKPQMVRVGELDLSRSNEPNAHPEDVFVSSVTVHPGYKLPSYYNDIALLHLSKAVRLNKYVKPVCVANNPRENYEGKLATLTGWGHMEFGGDRSMVLQEVGVTVWNNAACKKSYSPPRVPIKNYPQGIVDSQLCAGDPLGGKDACQGDSGGPLVVKSGNTHTLIGIVSSGIGCGAKSFPGVYSRVSAYADWITKNVKPLGPNKPSHGSFPSSFPGGLSGGGLSGGNGYSGYNHFGGHLRGNPYLCSGFNPC